MRPLLFLIGSLSFAATIRLTVVGTTETQIVVSYEATTSGPCTLSAVDNNNGPAVADLDATRFPNANQDLSRTVANGYFWPTLVNGLLRTVVIGTHDQIKKGMDGLSYSTALQANTDHTITVTCNSGADTGRTQAQTANVSYGSYYPELPIPDPTQVTFGMQPTINWASTAGQYIDPITGVLLQRISGPTDSFNDTNPFPMVFATPVIDVNGGAWTNPANFTTNQVSSTLATTSTANAPIFAPLDPSYLPANMFTDFNVTLFGNGSSSSVQAGACISKDSGNHCANATPQNVTFGTSVQAYSPVPGAWSGTTLPSSYFAAWGGINGWFGTEDLANRTFTGVNCSGTPTVCTMASPSGVVGFNLSRVAGSKFQISGTGCTTTTFSVATVDSWQQMTTQQTAGGTWTNCTYRDLSVGIRVTLNNSGTLNVSLTGNGADARSGLAGSSGSKWTGALAPVTDISTDCNGNAQSPPLSGYLLGLPSGGVYLIQSNGVSCLQSNLYNANYSVHGTALPNGAIPFLNNSCFLTGDFATPQNIWKVCHVPNNYKAISVNFTSSATVDNFTWTNLGPTTAAGGIQAQVIAAGGAAATALNSGLWPNLGLDTVGDNGAGSGLIQYRSTAAGQDSECIVVWADANNNLISAFPVFGSYPYSYSACHFSGEQEANYSQVNTEAESSQLSPIFFNATLLLGGPFVSRSSAGMYKNGSLTTWSLSITSCTNTSPTVCTSANNNLDNITGLNSSQGAWIQIGGGTGSWAAINGGMYAHYISGNNTFSLYSDPVGASPVNATGFGGFTGTVTATMLPPLYSITISSVLNSGGNARMAGTYNNGYGRYFPSQTNVMQDGDPITIVQNYLHSTTQYYAKVSSAPAGDFDVFLDPALTMPASYSSLSGMGGGYAVLAQSCPDPATLRLPGPLYMDTGIGTTGAGNQYVRCVKIRLHDEGCSDFPKAGEQAVYPCASDPTNTNRSSLHQINVGDAFGDVSHFGNNHEVLFVLAVNRVSTNQIDVTLERSYGDDPNFGWRGSTNGAGDTFSLQHSPGWTLWAEAAIPGAFVQTVSIPTFAVPPINGAHNDFVPGITPGNVSQVSGYQGTDVGYTVPDSKMNVTISQFTGPFTNLHSSFPFWGMLNGPASLNSLNQSYPSMRQIYGQAPSSEYNPAFSWNGDWMAMNGAFGNPQNSGDGVGLNRTLTNIRGGTYDPTSATTIVYLIPTFPAAANINVKVAPVEVTNWPSSVFTDISGPASLISDTQQGSYCVVYTAGECRPNSTPGQVFVAMRNYSDAYGQCIANNATLGFPCAFGLWPGAGWAVQVRNNPIDMRNLGARKLTLGWTPPLSHYDFSNWISTPDAKWGLFAGNPIQQRPLRGQYSGTHWFAMKLPPSPAEDTTLRSTFMPLRISLPGVSGDMVRVAFGYAENGNPVNFYCTSRAETCYTSASATTTNPFVFASETQGYTSCSSGCEVNIPAIPGRILYYLVQRQNGSVNSTSSLGVVPVP